MSSPVKDGADASTHSVVKNGTIVAKEPEGELTSSDNLRPPSKRPATVIEISDTESDDSDVCAVNTYRASADEVKRIRGG